MRENTATEIPPAYTTTLSAFKENIESKEIGSDKNDDLDFEDENTTNAPKYITTKIEKVSEKEMQSTFTTPSIVFVEKTQNGHSNSENEETTNTTYISLEVSEDIVTTSIPEHVTAKTDVMTDQMPETESSTNGMYHVNLTIMI